MSLATQEWDRTVYSIDPKQYRPELQATSICCSKKEDETYFSILLNRPLTQKERFNFNDLAIRISGLAHGFADNNQMIVLCTADQNEVDEMILSLLARSGIWAEQTHIHPCRNQQCPCHATRVSFFYNKRVPRKHRAIGSYD